MKNWCLTFCLAITALFGSGSAGSTQEPIRNYPKTSIFAEMGRPVGRLDIKTDNGLSRCTAFIVSKKHILTSFHCSLGILENERLGATRIDAMQFVAGYTRTGIAEGTNKYRVIPTPVESSRELDYAVHEILGNPSEKYGMLRLSYSIPKARDPLWIIGHPLGKGQHISREKCRAGAPAVNKNKLIHTCDVLPGNSGSPVIDPGLQQVVAMHHAGIAKNSVNLAILMSKILANSKVLQAYSASEAVAPPKKTCFEDAMACSNADLCSKAQSFSNGKYTWQTGAIYRQHVTEAKRRGLACGVTEMVAKKTPNPYSNLPDCPSSTDVIWTNCFATYTGKEGGTYEGEWKDDEYHGMGTYTYVDGTKYVGQFKKQEFDGKGSLTYTDGTKYIGNFLKDKAHGRGEYTFGSDTENVGDVYVGEFKEDKFHGQGIYTQKDGTVIKGVWKDDELQSPEGQTPKVTSKDRANDDEVISASSGSGFAVSYDGHVITNNHVIEGCQEVVVHHKGDEIPAKVITYDTQNDLALLKGDFVPETVFPLSVERPELLQEVYVAGYPFGKEISTSVKVTKGIISSLTGIGNNFSNMQIDAALQPGNSGGPILDEKGNLVGVAVAKLDLEYIMETYGVVPEGTNFGIKSNVVRNLLDSNEVDYPSASRSSISTKKLGKMITSGTYYISCWMTMAQIEAMQSKKVMFSNLD